MQLYEYTVIPAPARGEKARGARTGIERFAVALSMEINRMAEDGWEYIRAEVLPCEERSGLTSRQTVYHNVLVFRRALRAAQPQPAPQPVQQPLAAPALVQSPPRAAPVPQPAASQPAAPLTARPAAAPPREPAPPVQPVARMEPPLSAAGRAEPPADWPDAAPPAGGPDSDALDDRGTSDLAAPARTATRTGIFSTTMHGVEPGKPAHRLGPAER